jgi:hypothetical protein
MAVNALENLSMNDSACALVENRDARNSDCLKSTPFPRICAIGTIQSMVYEWFGLTVLVNRRFAPTFGFYQLQR